MKKTLSLTRLYKIRKVFSRWHPVPQWRNPTMISSKYIVEKKELISPSCSTSDRTSKYELNSPAFHALVPVRKSFQETHLDTSIQSSSEKNPVFFAIAFNSHSTQNRNIYKCMFSNSLTWTLSVLLLDSVAWFVPEICHFKIDWSEFHVSKNGQNSHPPTSRLRGKLSYLLNGLSHSAAQKLKMKLFQRSSW